MAGWGRGSPVSGSASPSSAHAAPWGGCGRTGSRDAPLCPLLQCLHLWILCVRGSTALPACSPPALACRLPLPPVQGWSVRVSAPCSGLHSSCVQTPSSPIRSGRTPPPPRHSPRAATVHSAGIVPVSPVCGAGPCTGCCGLSFPDSGQHRCCPPSAGTDTVRRICGLCGICGLSSVPGHNLRHNWCWVSAILSAQGCRRHVALPVRLFSRHCSCRSAESIPCGLLVPVAGSPAGNCTFCNCLSPWRHSLP